MQRQAKPGVSWHRRLPRFRVGAVSPTCVLLTQAIGPILSRFPIIRKKREPVCFNKYDSLVCGKQTGSHFAPLYARRNRLFCTGTEKIGTYQSVSPHWNPTMYSLDRRRLHGRYRATKERSVNVYFRKKDVESQFVFSVSTPMGGNAAVLAGDSRGPARQPRTIPGIRFAFRPAVEIERTAEVGSSERMLSTFVQVPHG